MPGAGIKQEGTGKLRGSEKTHRLVAELCGGLVSAHQAKAQLPETALHFLRGSFLHQKC